MSNIRVYRYGLRAPVENAALISEQLQKAHKYRNVLVEIERRRRAKQRELLSSLPAIGDLQTQLKAADDELEVALGAIRKTRAETHKRSETPEMKAAVKAARAKRSEIKHQLLQIRQQLRENQTLATQTAAIDEEAHQERLKAREECGCYWGTYLNIEAADFASQKAPLFADGQPNNPRFVPAAMAPSLLGVQFQKGLPVEEAFADDTRFQIKPVDPKAFIKETPRGDRRRLSYTTLKMRIGSDASKKPIWGAWPLEYHREIPRGAVLKTAAVKRSRVGPQTRWHLLVTADLSDVKTTIPSPKTSSAVAIDLGWRQLGSGDEASLHVASWGDQAGASGGLQIDAKLLSALRYASILRGIRDTAFAEAHKQICRFLAATSNKPEWLAAATTTIEQWRSPARLAALALRWRAMLPTNDAPPSTASWKAAYDDLEKWRYHDWHLWKWECAQRSKSINRRQDLFKCFAKNLALNYETLVLGDLDLSLLQRHKPIESDKAENETANRNRQLAAVGELRLILVNAFQTRGRAVVKLPTEKPTADQTTSTKWPQLLERWRAMQTTPVARGNEIPSGTATKAPSKWAKAKERAAEKRQQKGGAREAVGNEAE